MKFVHKGDIGEEAHWAACEKSRAPFILVSNEDGQYARIFFDITNYNVDLAAVSDAIKLIYKSYTDFFLIPASSVAQDLDEHYMFSFPVRKEHAETIANQLFDYLKQVFLESPKR